MLRVEKTKEVGRGTKLSPQNLNEAPDCPDHGSMACEDTHQEQRDVSQNQSIAQIASSCLIATPRRSANWLHRSVRSGAWRPVLHRRRAFP